jgi:predicted nucleotidyltransferase
MTIEQESLPRRLEVEPGLTLSTWAKRVGERYSQVTHVYVFGSKVRGNPVKDDTDVFLMLEAMSLEEQQELAERIYADSEIDFPGLDLFLNFPSDGRHLVNWKTEGIIFESETCFWHEGVDYQLLWERTDQEET